MFEDLDTAEAKTEERRDLSSDEDVPSSNLYRWAHFPGFLTFGVLMIPLHVYRWGWEAAIAGGYTVFVYFFAFGHFLRNADDFFGDPRPARIALKLLPAHLLALGLVVSGVWLWFHVRPALPDWMTQEGRRGSFWDLFGWMALLLGVFAQGSWMANRIKRLFREPSGGSRQFG